MRRREEEREKKEDRIMNMYKTRPKNGFETPLAHLTLCERQPGKWHLIVPNMQRGWDAHRQAAAARNIHTRTITPFGLTLMDFQ